MIEMSAGISFSLSDARSTSMGLAAGGDCAPVERGSQWPWEL